MCDGWTWITFSRKTIKREFREINESKNSNKKNINGELMSDLDNIEREIEGLQRKMYDIQKTLENMDRNLESYLERIARSMERISEKL